MLLATGMASRVYSREEVLGLLDCNEEQDTDDPQEVVMEGSDEEFEDLESGTDTNT